MSVQLQERKSGNSVTILAVDTATTVCSVALADRGGTLAELSLFQGETHSKHLAAMVDSLLEVASLRLEEVDAFAVDVGPGTFTGLRIGLATIKGLAAATRKPAVGVSSLDTLAGQAGFSTGQVCCMLDARRGEVYTARYAVRNRKIERITPEQALAPHEAVAAEAGPCLYIGTGAVAYRDVIAKTAGQAAWFVEGEANHLRAATVARLGLRKLGNLAFSDPASLVPNYIRRSDAEYNKSR